MLWAKVQALIAINLEKQLSSPNSLQSNFASFPSLSNGLFRI